MTTLTISREEAQELAERCATLLRGQFGARRVVLFGSAAGDAPWHSRSDLDLAVEGLPPEKHWQALNACYELLPPELTLDLIPLESAWPELRARIEGEVEMPEDPNEALIIEVENELGHLRQLVDKLSNFLQNAPSEPDEIQIQGGAKYLHDFYNGVERIFERIAVRVDGDLPAGSNWHTLLLQRMGQPFGTRRPAVIERSMEVQLVEYLRFRHLFRHTYGYDLKWHRVRELSQEVSSVFRELKDQLRNFLSGLSTGVSDREE